MTRAEFMGGGPADGWQLELRGDWLARQVELRVPHCLYGCPGVWRYRNVGPMDGRDGVRIVYMYAGEAA